MKKINLLLFILLSVNLSAQEYFQQETNYIIDVTLDDEDHTLKGMEYIDYPIILLTIWSFYGFIYGQMHIKIIQQL